LRTWFGGAEPGARGRRSAPALRDLASDGVAILVFVTIGQVSHHGHVSVAGYAEDALPLLAAWFAVAWLAGGRFLPTWLAGVSAGVLLRAAILRHWYPRELAFWLVAVATIGLFAGAGRLALRLVERHS
jgi:hypothetical protein